MVVGECRGPGAVGVDDGQGAAAAFECLELAAEVRRGRQAPVGHQRVGADYHQMVGAIQVGHGECERVAEQIPAGDLLGHLVQGAGGVDVAGPECPDDRRRIQAAGDGMGVRVTEVDRDRGAAGLGDDPAQTLGGRVERLRPTRFDQRAVPAHQWRAQPVGVVVEFGEAGPLRADEAVAEHILAVTAGGGHPAALGGENQAARRFAERTDSQRGCGLGGRHGSRHDSHCAPVGALWQLPRSNPGPGHPGLKRDGAAGGLLCLLRFR